MTKHPLKDITFVHCTEKPHVFPSETNLAKLPSGTLTTAGMGNEVVFD